MDELKPCPFCGEKLVVDGEGRNAIYKHPRNDCFLAVADTEYEEVWFYCNDNLCIKKWNRRCKDD